MNEKSKMIAVPIGASMEYYTIEGDEDTARMILEPFGVAETPVHQRLRRENVARDISERLGRGRSTLAPLPEMTMAFQSQRYLRPARTAIMLANL
jgi:hypothetical protein